jgi:adenosylcobyric acid synthase
MENAILRQKEKGCFVIVICGGYQMLGESIEDTCGAEGIGKIKGMGLLPVETRFETEKTRTRVEGCTLSMEGAFEKLSGKKVSGYEIHMGKSVIKKIENTAQTYGHTLCINDREDGCFLGNVFGTYLHGIFDEEEFRTAFVRLLCDKKNLSYETKPGITYQEYKEQQYEILARNLRENIDMEKIYQIVGVDLNRR